MVFEYLRNIKIKELHFRFRVVFSSRFLVVFSDAFPDD